MRRNKFDEESIFHTLKDRPELIFKGRVLTEEEADGWLEEVLRTETGQLFSNPYDYVERRKDGDTIAVIVANYSQKDVSVSNPYEYLPEILSIYVKEEYRHQGIATDMIHEFLDYVERYKVVVDAEEKTKSFYDQLGVEVIYLDQFKERKTQDRGGKNQK